MEVKLTSKEKSREPIALINKQTGGLFLSCFQYDIGMNFEKVNRHLIYRDNEVKGKGTATIKEVYDKNPSLFTRLYEGDEISIKF